MEYINRELEETVKSLAGWFPIVSVTGPRQSGKSTLIRHIFSDYDYINLEDRELLRQANTDPVGFINNRPNRLIIDEAQLSPPLFSQVQVRSDENDETGQYIMSGSQNFTLLNSIKQSLAGRVGICRLLPLSYRELRGADGSLEVEDVMIRGGFPRLYTKDIPHSTFFESYLQTYLLRDASNVIREQNLYSFRHFAEICAHYTGNLLNITNLSRRAEINRSTATEWLNLLHTSYITFLLYPYHENKLKSLTKTPKLYFYDTGLLAYMLGVNSKEEMLLSPYLGQIYENFIISETIKKHLNANIAPRLYFYRDDSKVEVDLIDMTNARDIALIEIKSGETSNDRYFKQVNTAANKLNFDDAKKQVVMRIPHSYNSYSGRFLASKDYLLQ